MLGGGAGSILDMINRFRDNRAMLGRRKIRFKQGKRYFDEKPVMTARKNSPAIFREPFENQLHEIRTKFKKDARFNLFASAALIIVCLALLIWFINWVVFKS